MARYSSDRALKFFGSNQGNKKVPQLQIITFY